MTIEHEMLKFTSLRRFNKLKKELYRFNSISVEIENLQAPMEIEFDEIGVMAKGMVVPSLEIPIPISENLLVGNIGFKPQMVVTPQTPTSGVLTIGQEFEDIYTQLDIPFYLPLKTSYSHRDDYELSSIVLTKFRDTDFLITSCQIYKN